MLKSEFIKLIPEHLIISDTTKRKQWDNSAIAYRDRIQEIRAHMHKDPGSSLSKQNGSYKEDGNYQEGQIVQHKMWGRGKIHDVEGVGEKAKLTIVFTGNVTKKLIAGYANLKIIE